MAAQRSRRFGAWQLGWTAAGVAVLGAVVAFVARASAPRYGEIVANHAGWADDAMRSLGATMVARQPYDLVFEIALGITAVAVIVLLCVGVRALGKWSASRRNPRTPF
ncbi:hypothetical protein PU630_07250 [Microbacterium horticulturae]|uniref:Transmembrane protein n=1 Tax=Microbacterium horticulturae TaxID=3028316 RepID=A0ABY8C3P1_9MICO|nr:hypothetical protein [Microbacterium sp. KACC 23027]WEG10337.1 hypothetical protein PU630_07250 [Microbacterium sp. KACC 23027]